MKKKKTSAGTKPKVAVLNKRKTRKTGYDPTTGKVFKTTGRNRSVSYSPAGGGSPAKKVVTVTRVKKNRKTGGTTVKEKSKTKNISQKRVRNQYNKAVKRVARKDKK